MDTSVDYSVPERRIRQGFVEGGVARLQAVAGPRENVSEAEVADVWRAAGMKVRGERVVELLYRYGVLRSFQLRYLVYERDGLTLGSARTISRGEFSAMAKYGIIQHIAIFGEHSAYVLGDWGRAWLRVAKGIRKFQADKGKLLGTRGSQLWHDLMVADFQMAVWRDVESLGGEFVWLKATDAATPAGRTVQWDALGRARFAGLARGFDYCLEIDRNTETVTEFGKKVGRYAKYLKERGWRAELGRESFPEVLVVTSGNEGRLRRLRAEVELRLRLLKLEREMVWDFTAWRRLEEGANPLAQAAWSASGDEGDYQLLDYAPVGTGIAKELEQLRQVIPRNKGAAEEVAARVKVLEQAAIRLQAMKEGATQ